MRCRLHRRAGERPVGRAAAVSWEEARRRAELVAAGAALERQGLLRGREGNLSCRLDDGRILLTPRGVPKGRLALVSLLRLTLGEPPPETASSEAPMHLEIFRRLEHVRAIVHAHPPAVLALSLMRPTNPVPSPTLLTGGEAVLRAVEAIPALAPGSQALARAAAEALAKAPVAVMVHHGAVAVGETPLDALARLELLELLARLELLRSGQLAFP